MEDKSTTRIEQNELDRMLAVPMFYVALLFLLITGFLLHTDPGSLVEEVDHYSPVLRRNLAIGLILLYLAVVGETIAHWVTGSKVMWQHALYLVVPFMRICPRDHIDGTHAWVVGLGWRRTTERFEQYMGRMFSGPMILIALLVLPVVGAEWIWREKILENATWRLAIQTATGFIWMAFVFEFVIMVTVVEKKFRYCKKNWIDLAIIILPFIAFLRAARLGRLMKLQQLSRTAKIYRMRGLALRTWRAVVTLDVISTLLRRDSSYRIDKLGDQIRDKEQEIRLLQNELERVREKDIRKKEAAAATDRPVMRFSYKKK